MDTPHYSSEDFINLPLSELRQKWEQAWGIKPHKYIGRRMLAASLVYKVRELNGQGLTRLQREKLDELVKMYKRNPRCFDDKTGLKAGVRLVRMWKGERVIVTVEPNGVKYKGTLYTSLSAAAKAITGTSWNGWRFFGLKNPNRK